MRVSLLDASELVRVGFTAMLSPHAHRARVVEQPHPERLLQPCDLLLVDFAAMPPARVEDLLLRADPAGRIVSYSWTRRPPSGPWWSTAADRVSGHVGKSLPAARLLDHLEAIHRGAGTPNVPPERRAPTRQRPRAGRLTPRELDVLSRIARGLSNAEIAEELFLSVNSVKTYVRTAYRKIGVATRSQAVAWWFADDRDDEQASAETDGDRAMSA